jgi:hypothetical protein
MTQAQASEEPKQCEAMTKASRGTKRCSYRALIGSNLCARHNTVAKKEEHSREMQELHDRRKMRKRRVDNYEAVHERITAELESLRERLDRLVCVIPYDPDTFFLLENILERYAIAIRAFRHVWYGRGRELMRARERLGRTAVQPITATRRLLKLWSALTGRVLGYYEGGLRAEDCLAILDGRREVPAWWRESSWHKFPHLRGLHFHVASGRLGPYQSRRCDNSQDIIRWLTLAENAGWHPMELATHIVEELKARQQKQERQQQIQRRAELADVSGT